MTTPSPAHRLHFPHLDREIASHESETLFQSARRQGVRIVGACGGRGTCGSCIVRISDGEVARHGSHATVDADGAAADGKRWVRACRVSARSNCTVEVAPRSLAAVVRTETDDGQPEFLPGEPGIRALDLQLPEASLNDNLADHDRLRRALGQPNAAVDLFAARILPSLLRQPGADWRLRAWQRGEELIAFGPVGQRSLGLAVDLGTTNAAAFLVDLDNGQRLASLGIENPQVAWGADLISRINHASQRGEVADELRGAAVAAINALAHDLCHAVGQPATDIVDVVVCGNTAMHHLLLGLPVRQLGRAPFVAAVRDGLDLKARELGLAVAPGAWVHVVANIGGFVGGDHVTALVASENLWADSRAALVMDIGTNTEISVIHGGRILSASAPSGPALEGGHIACGMRAAEGAIEKVFIEDGRLCSETIGQRKAVGLCGSGVLDALAALHRGGLINDSGRLLPAHPDLATVNGKKAVKLAADVYFTQDDVRAVQLAKAAIRTATELLLDEAGIAAGDLDHFIIAGAFGAYIDVASAVAIGLLPDLPRQRFAQIGNAAGLGVRQMLASVATRRRADELARSARYVELSSRGDFQKIFLQHIGFNKNHSGGNP